MRLIVICAIGALTVACEGSTPDASTDEAALTVAPAVQGSYYELRAAAQARYDEGKWQHCRATWEGAADASSFESNKREALYNAGCCAVRAGQTEEAFDLLGRAILAGYDDLAHLADDRDLQSLHGDPRWNTLRMDAQAKVDARLAKLNKELAEMARADQEDRRGGMALGVFERDAERRAKARAILVEGGAKVAQDYFHAALVFQHSPEVGDVEWAHELAAKAHELDPKDGEIAWLYAASLDRALMKKGEPQKYGTQFAFDPKTDTWSVHPWDPTVTDVDREKLNVPPLADAHARVVKMNEVRKTAR